ncbi:LysR substrate-binding domain-containing protein [Gordonia sp. CPCC 205515]|uniref:LysR substrate-binding domain-containing protein n=1 Tax=Gordonia sp. CPCC 205515 TaxID=3140791 RepID=UPI003AF3F273
MEIRQLRALVAVADTGSVTKAAAHLHVVQPAVTKQIRMLETELGVDLFERSRSGMRLNASGRQVLERARRALAELDRAAEDVRSAGGDIVGLVTVGLLPSAATLLAPLLVSAVADAHPGIRLRLSVGYAGHLAQWLEAGDVDVALLFEQPIAAAFEVRALLLEDLWVVGPASAELTAGEPISLTDALSHPMILPNAPHGLRSIVDAAAASVGQALSIPVETNDSAVQLRLVEEGYGWTVLPSVLACAVGPALSSAPVANPSLTRSIGTATARQPESSRASIAVTQLLRETVAHAVTSGRWPSARLL